MCSLDFIGELRGHFNERFDEFISLVRKFPPLTQPDQAYSFYEYTAYAAKRPSFSPSSIRCSAAAANRFRGQSSLDVFVDRFDRDPSGLAFRITL